jgi:chromosome segregation ATPase
MSDLKRIEDHLHQLIGLVGKIKETTDDTKKELAVVKQDVAMLKQDVAVLKQDAAVLKQDVAVLKQDVAVLKQDVTAIRQDLSSLRQEFESEKEWNRTRSNEILKEVRNVSFEMEHLRNKTAKNESDLFVLKQSFSELRS